LVAKPPLAICRRFFVRGSGPASSRNHHVPCFLVQDFLPFSFVWAAHGQRL
jgi:hypothetical protein